MRLGTLAWPAPWGRPGAAAALALVLAVPLATLAPRWQAEAEAARAQARAQARRAPPPPAREATLHLPADPQPAERVADLLEQAVHHGVTIERTQQRTENDGGVLRLRLGTSARAAYADLRAFIAEALRSEPALSLDSVQWRRASAQDGELQAELQWAIVIATPERQP